MNTLPYAKEILRGKDLYRILMNEGCEVFELKGSVLDIGAGAGTPSYLRFFKKREGCSIASVDALLNGDGHVDFEKDPLPQHESSVDMALLLNVLEHIYRFDFLLHEAHRVLREGGRLIGVVPFLINYHPDPHDHWRYTKETLKKILTEAGFREIGVTEFGTGPFAAAFSQVEFMVPRLFKLVLVPVVLGLDRFLHWLNPTLIERLPLGFFFTAKK